MPERVRQIARNEALFREVNDEIEKLEDLHAITGGTLHIVCECGDLACAERIVVPTIAYERVRADATLFFIKPGHDKPEVEDTIEQTERYHVVRKRAVEAVAIV